jgi:hypothetical protein
VTAFTGRWLARDGLILTAIAAPTPAARPGHNLFWVIRQATPPTTKIRTEHGPVGGTHTTKLRLFPGA